MENKKNYSKLKHYGSLEYVSQDKYSWHFKILSWCKLQGKGFSIAKPFDMTDVDEKEYCYRIAEIALQNLFDGVKIVNF